MPQRLPPDNYPDDLDNAAYKSYRASFRPGLGLWLRGGLPRLIVAVGILGMIAAGFVAALFILPPSEPQIVVIPVQSSPTPIGDVAGAFPSDVAQNFLELPARVDNNLAGGGRRGYRFFIGPGLTWQISLTGSGNFVMTVYDPSGNMIDIGAGPFTLTAQNSAQYALLVESPSGGSYTLRIFPQ